MAAFLKSGMRILWRSKVLRWLFLGFWLLINLFSCIFFFVYPRDYVMILHNTQMLSLPFLVFFLFWGYELLRGVASTNLIEVFRGVRGGPLRAYGGLLSIGLLPLLLLTANIILWNLTGYLTNGVAAPAALWMGVRACLLNLFLVGLVALLLALVFARSLPRLSAYSLGVLFVFLNSPLLSAARNVLSFLPDSAEIAVNRVLDWFVLVPQGMRNYPSAAYGQPIEPYRWQIALLWVFLLGAVLAFSAAGRKRLRPRAAGAVLAAACAVCLVLSYQRGCAMLYDWRPDGLFGDQGYELYKQSDRSDFSYDFRDPGFRVARYDMELTIKKDLALKAAMTLDGAGRDGSYEFTLHHGMKLDSVRDEAGNTLRYQRDGDFFTVELEPQSAPAVIVVEAHGGNPTCFANTQGVNLPGYYSYYPMPGNRLLMTTFGLVYRAWDLVNSEDTQFRLQVDYHGTGTLYCNLPGADGVFEGTAQTVTLVAGLLTETVVDGVSVIDSAYEPSHTFWGNSFFETPPLSDFQKFLEKGNQLLGADVSYSLTGKPIFFYTDNVAGGAENACFSDHVVLTARTDSAQLAAAALTQNFSFRDKSHLRLTASGDFSRSLASYLRGASGEDRLFGFDEDNSGFQPRYGNWASDYFDKAAERYSDEEILQRVYAYLIQENPQQPIQEFMLELAGISAEEANLT